jgi:hypothetical protein
MEMTTDSVAQRPSIARWSSRMLRKHPEIWAAIVLWIASCAFVGMVSVIATWEGIGSYHGTDSLCRWDCGWFATIVDHGYDPQRRADGFANWPFHPLHPLFAYPLHHYFDVSTATSLVLASRAALLFAIYGFILMLGDEAGSTTERFMAGSLVAFNPYIIYAHAGYSEALYFALLAFAFYFAHRKFWVESGLMGCLVSATRQVGAAFIVPYAMMALPSSDWRKFDRSKLIGLLLCPIGALAYVLYLYKHTGDPLALIHVHAAWVAQPFGNPVLAIWEPLQKHHWPRVWAIMVLGGLLATAWLLKIKKPELGVSLGLSILIALLGGSYANELFAMPRYIWWQPPLLYAIYMFLKRYTALFPVYLAFACGMASFVIVGWYTGHNFVV